MLGCFSGFLLPAAIRKLAKILPRAYVTVVHVRLLSGYPRAPARRSPYLSTVNTPKLTSLSLYMGHITVRLVQK